MALWSLVFLTISLGYIHCEATENPIVDENATTGNVTLTRAIGNIQSPGYDNNKYPHKADRWWTIVASKGMRVHLTFEVLHIKNPFHGCGKDYVTVYRDSLNLTDKEVYCTYQPPSDDKPIISVGNELKIHFVSDKFYTNDQGFWAKYEFVDENGNAVTEEFTESPDDDYYDDDYYDEATTETSTTTTPKPPTTTTTPPTTTTTPKSSTTTPPTTTTPKSSTTTPPTTTTPKSSTTTPPTTTTTATATKPVSVIITKITTHPTGVNDTKDNKLISGVVLGMIVAIIVIIVGAVLLAAFVRWRKQKKSQFISLRESHSDQFVNTDDTKQLVNESQTSIYKKQNGFISVPQQDTFPL